MIHSAKSRPPTPRSRVFKSSLQLRMEEAPAAGRGSRQSQIEDDDAKIDNEIPVPQNRRQRRNAFGACSAPPSRPGESDNSHPFAVAYPAVRPATPGTCRTAHIAAQGSARHHRISSSASASGTGSSPLRTREASPPVVKRPVLSPPIRPAGQLLSVQLPYSHGQPDAETEPFPEFVDTEIQSDAGQQVVDKVEDQAGASTGPAHDGGPRRRRASISPASFGTVPSTEVLQVPAFRQRARSRASGPLPPVTNLPLPPRE